MLRHLAHHLNPSPAAAAAEPAALPPWYKNGELDTHRIGTLGSQYATDTRAETLDAVQLDSHQYVANRLSPAERQQFDKEGWLVVQDCLPAAAYARAAAALDNLRALRHAQGLKAGGDVLEPVFSQSHELWREEEVVRMLSAEKVKLTPRGSLGAHVPPA
jgi:hypothetical protein